MGWYNSVIFSPAMLIPSAFNHRVPHCGRGDGRRVPLAFAMTGALDRCNAIPFDLPVYSFLHHYLGEPHFAENKTVWPARTEFEWPEIQVTAHKKLKAQCCRLLELDSQGKISYTN